MKIAVFDCPSGISGKGVISAFQDAGLPSLYLKKGIKSYQRNRKCRALVARILGKLKQVKHFDSKSSALRRLIIGTSVAISYFGIEKNFVRNLGIGRKGNADTLKILRGFALDRIPINQEIVTPEGAAILATLCEKEGSIPSMQLERVGFGPVSLKISIGETVAPYRRERILVLETNIDDMSPQGFELLYERLFKAGALDVWVEPILMKKMRPAFKLSVLLDHKEKERITEEVFKETPTLGVRFFELDRFSLPRKTLRFRSRFGPVRMKIGFLDSKHRIASPEYQDLKRISRKKGLSFTWVYRACLSDWAKSKIFLD